MGGFGGVEPDSGPYLGFMPAISAAAHLEPERHPQEDKQNVSNTELKTCWGKGFHALSKCAASVHSAVIHAKGYYYYL